LNLADLTPTNHISNAKINRIENSFRDI